VKFNEASRHAHAFWDFAFTKLGTVARTLVAAGWQIDADGKVFRSAGAHQMEVSSGVDWFELHGTVQYGETSAKLPELLAALRRGDSMVKLADGTFGMLPEDWLNRIGMLAGMGSLENGHIRFRPSQAGLLDALLAMQPEAKFDKKFARIRTELREFEGVFRASCATISAKAWVG
jgi:Bacterial SNF2 helicase associated